MTEYLPFFRISLSSTNGEEALVSTPVAARGFMSGRDPKTVLARAHGRDEVSEANEGFGYQCFPKRTDS